MPALLVLHGITMSGPSMLRTLGPIADALRAEGLELIAPNAGVRLGAEALAGFVRWAERAYAARGQVAGDVFRAGGFWEAEERGEHYDWFAGATVDGLKTFAGLEAGLDAIVEAVAGREVVGVLGFSQGCAMAGLVAGLARAGHLPFGNTLRFAVLLSGFRPVFDRPVFAPSPWPIGELPALVVWGREDPIFPDEATIRGLAAELADPELHILDHLGHEVPRDPAWVARIAAFARAHAHAGA
ncbi:MAG: hypothetical protein H6711_10090 [Myxococcales bacterium]|nr:hypothetical protein [Myxococcales bacterium]